MKMMGIKIHCCAYIETDNPYYAYVETELNKRRTKQERFWNFGDGIADLEA